MYQGTLDCAGNFNATFTPDLKTESGLSKNLMFKRLNPQATLTLSFWQNDMDDAIFRQTNVFTLVTNYQNIDRVRSRGIEFIGPCQGYWSLP
ncbi:TonB-dependent receptor [Alcanivorax sp. MD8A]|uniref:TonB-dependent receptor n=1 Tax=Alcanivorax sp. MD8A TaxID=1177157 RepID=UPI003512FBF1